MGYKTHYTLEVLGVDELAATKIIADLRDINPEARLAFCSWGGREEPVKWPEWQEDMTRFSHDYPDVVFLLWGDGENGDDFWRAYFKNGVCEEQEAEIVYPDPPEWAKGL